MNYKSHILFVLSLLMICPGGYANNNGGVTSWNYYIQDHLGSTRLVVDSNNNVKETINYYPYGSEMTMTTPSQISPNPDWQPYRFTGKELMRQHSLNMYDFGARLFDVAGLPMWTSMDPLCEKYYHLNPYMYCAGDPVNKFDPDGRSTRVKYIGDGRYEVIGGDYEDGDYNIYVYTQDKNGDYKIQGESLGVTTSLTSFYNSDKNEWAKGSIIDTNDMSGIDFLVNIVVNTPCIIDYKNNAGNHQLYDF